MNKKDLHKIKRICEDFLANLGIEGKAEITEEGGLVSINIKTPCPGLLIGYHGQTLVALEHLLIGIIFQNVPSEEYGKVILDVEGYKKEQEGKLSVIIERVAEKVRQTGRPEILRPMTSYERRHVHVLLKDREGLTTESLGEEPDRRVVIKPLDK